MQNNYYHTGMHIMCKYTKTIYVIAHAWTYKGRWVIRDMRINDSYNVVTEQDLDSEYRIVQPCVVDILYKSRQYD